MSGSVLFGDEPESVLLARGLSLGADFDILSPLGNGGMGRVYLARQRSTNTLRAVKVLRNRYAGSPDFRARFEREARIVGRIASEHVIKVVSAGVEPSSELCWYAMELLEGSNLEEHVIAHGLPNPAARYAILQQVFHALAAAHDLRIVHRDVKPANVFLARALRSDVALTIKVLDFGLAKQLSSGRTTTALGGTPAWGAPEQFSEGYVPAPQSDVWALGQLVFWLHTGHVLSGFLAEGVSAHARELGRPLPVAEGWDDWFSQCVHPLPESRFCHARAAWNALVQMLTPPRPEGVSIPVTAESDPHAKTELSSEPSHRSGAVAGTPTLADTRAPIEVAAAEPKAKPRRGQKVAVAFVGLAALGSAFAKFTFYHETVPFAEPRSSTLIPSWTPPVAATVAAPSISSLDHKSNETLRVPSGATAQPTRIEPGNFLMGWDVLGDDHRPHRVTVTTAFSLDRTEATVHEYAECVRAGRCSPTATGPGCHLPGEMLRQDHPVNCVTRAQARTYCKYRGASLPSEAEWEYAARGAEGRRYPWGAQRPTTCARAILAGACPEGTTAPVGGRPSGASPSGLLDLVGNVWEWTEDDWDPTAYHVSDGIDPVARSGNGIGVVRGGSYHSASHLGHAAVRRPLDETSAHTDVGFRCLVRAVN